MRVLYVLAAIFWVVCLCVDAANHQSFWMVFDVIMAVLCGFTAVGADE